MTSLSLRAAGAALVLMALQAGAWAQTYSITSLDRGPRVANSAYFAGSNGVAGTWVSPRSAGDRAWFYADRKFTDLGTLGGTVASVRGANASGQVIGVSNAPGDADFRAFSWTAAGGMVELSFGTWSYAAAINAAGQVVGDAQDAGGSFRAFSWTPAAGLVNLGTLGGSLSQAFSVNDAGQVVGAANLASEAGHAFVWTPVGGMVDLGTLGGMNSIAHAITASGQVVGSSEYSSSPGRFRAFVWTPGGGMVGLGSGIGSSADAVDPTLGQVVGTDVASDGRRHAFSWSPPGSYVILGNLGGNSTQPTAVNASGQVVGYAQRRNFSPSSEHAFAWSAATGLVDLGTLPPYGDNTSSRALFVTHDGQVFGESFHFTATTSEKRAFVWTASSGMLDLNDLTPKRPPGVLISSPRAVAEDGSIIAETSTGSRVVLRPLTR